MPSSAERQQLSIRFRQNDENIIVLIDTREAPNAAAIDLIVWPGGGIIETMAVWRLRTTRAFLGFADVGEA